MDGAPPLRPVIYQYPSAVRGLLVRRYKRFLADVVLQPPYGAIRDGGTAAAASGGGDAAPQGPGAVGSAATATAAAAAGSATRHGSKVTRLGEGGEGASCVQGPTDREPVAAAVVVAAIAAGAAGALAEAAVVGGGGEAVTCHCPNTGPMTGLLDWPMAPVVLSTSSAPGRKYAHTLEMIQAAPGGPWVGVHSALANTLVHALLTRRLLPQLGEWREMAREVPYGSHGSRVDFVLTRPSGRRLFMEVKSVTLAEPYRPSLGTIAAPAPLAGGDEGAASPPGASTTPAGPAPEGRRIALFPDTVSDRAQRHVRDLMEMVKQGHEAACVFVVQRDDCGLFAPCAAKDPEYAKLVRQAASSGVQMLALRTSLLPPSPSAGTTPPSTTSMSSGVRAEPSADGGRRALMGAAAAAAAEGQPQAVTGRGQSSRSRGGRRGVSGEDGPGEDGKKDAGSGGGGCGAAGEAGDCRLARVEYLGLAELALEYGSTADVEAVPAGVEVVVSGRPGRGGKRGGPRGAARMSPVEGGAGEGRVGGRGDLADSTEAAEGRQVEAAEGEAGRKAAAKTVKGKRKRAGV